MSLEDLRRLHRAELAEVVAEVHVLLLARRVGRAGERAEPVELAHRVFAALLPELLAVDAAGEVRAHEAVVVVAVVRVEHEEPRARVQLLGDRDRVLGPEEVVRGRRHRVVARRPHDLVERLRAQLDVAVAPLVAGVRPWLVGVAGDEADGDGAA